MAQEPKKTLWAEGTVLTQQHFQQEQAYGDRQRDLLHNITHPMDWGFVNLNFDIASLKQGLFVLKSYQAIFKSGQIANLEIWDEALSLRLKPEKTEPFYLYVCVAKSCAKPIPGYPELSQGIYARWQVVKNIIHDIYDSKRVAEV